jgi:hypothetical protein
MMSFGMPFILGPHFSLLNLFDAPHTGTFNMGSIEKARKLNSRAKAQKCRGLR